MADKRHFLIFKLSNYPANLTFNIAILNMADMRFFKIN